MKRSILALAVVLAAPVVPGVAHADLAFNVGAVTDYRYRGISQSRLKPAVQGGVDWSSGSGFYLGAWASSIKWIKDAGGGANAEIDLYGGYKGEISEGLAYDVGVLTYQYPGNDLDPSANTTELYGALSFGMFTAKVSHSVSNLFGFADSKNSSYFDASANLDLGDGWSVVPHVGYQKVRRNGDFSYWDYAVTLGKDFGNGLVATAAVVGTDTDAYIGGNDKNLGKAGVVLGIKYNF
ncbi:MAG: TorF family putative porin [Rubrivivax sp.]